MSKQFYNFFYPSGTVTAAEAYIKEIQ